MRRCWAYELDLGTDKDSYGAAIDRSSAKVMGALVFKRDQAYGIIWRLQSCWKLLEK